MGIRRLHDDRAESRPTHLARELGLPGLFDIHTHFMPANVISKVRHQFETGGPLIGPPWSLRYKQDEQALVALLRSFGVRRFTSLVYPHRPGMAAWLNDWAAEFAMRVPECVHSATFFCEPGAAGYVATALSRGARVFKAHLQVSGYDPLDPLLREVWGLLADAGAPVVVHCGSAPVPGTHTSPASIVGLLSRYPALTVIIAHLGQPEYVEYLELAERYANIYLDTTLVFTSFAEGRWPYPKSEIPRLREIADRIVLGSDFPNIPYAYHEQLEGLVRLGLGDAWLRGVLHDNSARLLGEVSPALRG